MDTFGADSQTSRTSGSNSGFALRGTIRTLVGATTAGRDSTCNTERATSIGVSTSRPCEGDNSEKKTHPALDVLFSTPEAVLEQDVEDAAETKGGLNDVRRELADYIGDRSDDSAPWRQ